MHAHRDFFADRAKDQAALIASVETDLATLPGPESFMRTYREAMARRGWTCRFCGKPSALATCDACLDEAGW